MNVKEFFLKNKETVQLVYGILLIILIPILIVYNTVFIIKKYNQTIDTALQQQVLTVGRTVYTFIENDLDNADFLQQKLDTLRERNNTFIEISILRHEDKDFKVIASTNRENIGKIQNYKFYELSFLEEDNNALATDSLRLKKSTDGEYFFEPSEAGDPYWLVAMPLRDADGNKSALLSMRVSAQIVEQATRYNRNASVFLLVFTIIIVVLFLSVAIRLWDYALLYKKIKEVDKMKDEFISIASHELRTPVTGIKGYSELIIDGTLGEASGEVKDGARKIFQATKRLAVLVEDLLNVSRIEQGRMEINSKAQDIQPIIKEVVEELAIQAEKKELELKYKASNESLPLVNIDKNRIKQILINIIGNSIKYTKKGTVEVRARVKDKKLEIMVKDSGIGMSVKERERLFQKFYRVQNENTKKISGTGLGLWITKELVNLMNGTISIDSIENVGTQVTILFPIINKNKN